MKFIRELILSIFVYACLIFCEDKDNKFETQLAYGDKNRGKEE